MQMRSRLPQQNGRTGEDRSETFYQRKKSDSLFMSNHIQRLAKDLARISRCQAEPNVARVVEIVHALPEELSKLKPQDFAADVQMEFVLVRNRIRATSGKTTWSINDFPSIAETAARLVAVLEKYERRDRRREKI